MNELKTLEEIESYIDSIRKDFFKLSVKIEKDLRDNEETKSHHIYSIKSRIKSHKSAFLKLRRKGKDIKDITDLLGLRALCLYDNDIDGAHLDILNYFFNNKCPIKEINIYASWDEDKRNDFIKAIYDLLNTRIEKEKHNGVQEVSYDNHGERQFFWIRETGKTSGYKSVHYVIGISNTFHENSIGIDFNRIKGEQFELQLRTILQDVWAETEHDISYKNNTHPHTKKLFDNLSKHIEVVQRQIETIRDIQNQDQRWVDYFKQRPNQIYLQYDKSQDVDKKMESYNAREKYEKYIAYTTDNKNILSNEKTIDKAEELLKEILNTIDCSDMCYFVSMEKAFILMLKGKVNDAYSLYSNYNNNYENNEEWYAVLFRIGEIFYLSGDLVEAFIHFDKCEKLIDDVNSNLTNRFNVYLRIANLYWSLGTDYYEIALSKIYKANSIYKENEELSKNDDYKARLQNNICWYTLAIVEKHIDSMDDNDDIADIVDRHMSDAHRYYNIIDNELNNDNKMYQNMADTSAWYCYLKAKHIKLVNKGSRLKILNDRKRWITKALEWSAKTVSDNFENRGVNPLRSYDLYRQHIEIILEEEEQLKMEHDS